LSCADWTESLMVRPAQSQRLGKMPVALLGAVFNTATQSHNRCRDRIAYQLYLCQRRRQKKISVKF